MKKIFSFIIAAVMILSLGTVAFADYMGAFDGIQLETGINPVVRVSENTFDYVIYMKSMTGLTNGDFTVSYDKSVLTLRSVKQTGGYSNSVYNDKDGKIYFSFMFDEPNSEAVAKMYILTFEYKEADVYPEMKVTNIKGTFIRSVKPVKVFEATEDNASISDGADKNDDFMQDNESYYKGDVNNDGVVTAEDARMILRHSAGLEKLYLDEYLRADFNGDDTVTAEDARLVLRKSAGLD